MAKAVAAVVVITLLVVLAPSVSAEEGQASWYGEPFHGKVMASGKIYDMYDSSTTASNIFPMGTWLKVTSVRTGRSVVVQVRDRGAFRWALDLSYAAFVMIDDPARMLIKVRYERVTGPGAAAEQPKASAQPTEPTATATPQPKATPTPQPTSATNRSSGQTGTQSSEYVVRAGDTLYGIAQRNGTSVAALVQINGLKNADAIVIGQVLRLKAPATATPAPAASASSAASSNSRASGTTYVVASGDTLSGIAYRHGLDPDQLVRANDLSDPDVLQVGRVLTIPSASGGKTAAAPATTPAKPKTHQVATGETLWNVAEMYGTSVAALVDANAIKNPDSLQVGQELLIPSGQASATPRSGGKHVVAEGETLSGIADRYGTTYQELAKLNALDDPGLLQPGQVLRLP